MRYGILLLMAIYFPATAIATDGDKIGLVLSGGGARGLAHIGIIRALEEHDIRIHAIAGTSMGAVIGALYASGRTPDEIEQIALELDWRQALDDEPARDKLAFRRKRDSRSFPARTQATLKGGVLSLPRGVVQGQNLQLLLQKLFLHVNDITDFDELPIRFRAVAGDLVTGEAVPLSRGSLATAVRASMAVPGFYAPVEVEGRLLADGGIANNLPVDEVKKMGVDRVIAVDITTPLYDADELDSIIPIVEQLTTLLTANQSKEQYALINNDDILIKPDLGDINTADFGKTPTIIKRGYDTIQEYGKALSTFTSDIAAHQARRGEYSPPIITEIHISNDSGVSDKLIRAQIDQQPGEALDREQLEDDIATVYAYEFFESVNYNVDATESGNRLVITAREKSWGNDLLAINFELYSDNGGDSGYDLGASFRKTGVTRRGGEWFTAARIGRNPLIRTELYLPLDYHQRFFVEPYAGYSEREFHQVTGTDIESRLMIDNSVYGMLAGIQVSNTAILGAGIEVNSGDTEIFTGIDTGTDHFRNVNQYWQLEVDTLNDLYFPSRGTLVEVRYERIDPHSDNNPDFELLQFSGRQAFPVNRHSLVLAASYVRSYGQVSGQHVQQSLGGFLNLSGFRNQALVGNDLGFASITWLHRLTGQSIFPMDVPVYMGVSLEAGNVWPSHSEASIHDLIGAGSIFLGADSPLGGVYLGYGRAEQGQSSFYVKLGRLF